MILLAATTGCSAMNRVNDALASTGAFDLAPSNAGHCDCAVAIRGEGRGRGVVTGKRTVLTVAHVVGSLGTVEVETSLLWKSARVVRKIPSFPEDLVELELVAEEAGFLSFEGFAADRQAQLRDGTAVSVATASGVHAWPGTLVPGDSGSPVLDSNGSVVGLVVGKSGTKGVMAPVADPILLARR